MAARKRSDRPWNSGTHANPRRKLTATAEQWALMDRAAGGVSWALWALDTLLRAAKRRVGR